MTDKVISLRDVKFNRRRDQAVNAVREAVEALMEFLEEVDEGPFKEKMKDALLQFAEEHLIKKMFVSRDYCAESAEKGLWEIVNAIADELAKEEQPA